MISVNSDNFLIFTKNIQKSNQSRGNIYMHSQSLYFLFAEVYFKKNKAIQTKYECKKT